ncbi:MAG: hypothetical protein Q8O67_17175 [Deltaproteobacteria bacterium]|nr:hypothetical protein [Deltaproteobacteria bacterium]
MLRPLLAVVVLSSSLPAFAAVGLSEEDFRLYCGYLDALAKPEVQKLKGNARDAKIAKLAKVKAPALAVSVEKGQKAGATCEEIGKSATSDTKSALDKALPGRITFFELDYSDPSHVVARVSWLGIEKKKLIEEAQLVAATLAETAPITKTIALRGVDPAAADRTADDAGWFDAKISRVNAARIEKAKIWENSARYKRFFDGIVER